jgi:hypothetical protein
VSEQVQAYCHDHGTIGGIRKRKFQETKTVECEFGKSTWIPDFSKIKRIALGHLQIAQGLAVNEFSDEYTIYFIILFMGRLYCRDTKKRLTCSKI